MLTTKVRDMIEQRLQKAAQLLRTSELSIKEITDAVGYEHHSSFTRAFKHRFGLSPRFYRLQSYSAATSMSDISINESDHQ